METINHECYVSLEVAKLLKEAGFDWECETCYIGKSKTPNKYDKYFNWNMPRKDFEKEGSDNLFHAFINQKKTTNFISAPTLDVAQRWLREVKDLYVNIIGHCKNNRYGVYIESVNSESPEYSPEYFGSFDTYEEAQEASIKKALEIILEKGK